MRNLLCAGLLALAAACGEGGSGSVDAPPPADSPLADFTLLFMGNSHTTVHDLPETVGAMVRAARPGRTVRVEVAPGWMFLEERAADPATLELLDRRRWSFVVLQAQKYSASGLFTYSTDGAVALARKARGARAVPILFPEWPRRGIAETQRIHDLHVSIAQREPACVAPIGQAWDLALARHPALALHDADGNHSAPAGAFLAALVIAATMTGASPDALPYIARPGVGADTQALLRRAAADTVLAYAPRQWCPADPYPS